MSDFGVLPKPIPFDQFFLVELINRGGMAEVYRAKTCGAEGFEKQRAIKKILPKVAEDKSFIDMLIDEAKITVVLTHPNIAQIDELKKVDGTYAIVMEYIAGRDLKALYTHAKNADLQLPIPLVCHVIFKVCEALGYAHDKTDAAGKPLEIVHRDVSPQNILISYDGDVKVIDFGIAKAGNRKTEPLSGVFKGKFSYMSPEQVRGERLDRRTDIFSLGIVMYELLTLTRLFRADTDFQTLQNINSLAITPPSEINPAIPHELETILLKALAGDRDLRYDNAYAFAQDIDRFLRNQGLYFSSKELADFMKDQFKADLEEEIRKQRIFKSWGLGSDANFGQPNELDTIEYDTAGIRLDYLETQHTDRHDVQELQTVESSRTDLSDPGKKPSVLGSKRVSYLSKSDKPYESSFPTLSDDGRSTNSANKEEITEIMTKKTTPDLLTKLLYIFVTISIALLIVLGIAKYLLLHDSNEVTQALTDTTH